jgi:hypothetical protein
LLVAVLAGSVGGAVTAAEPRLATASIVVPAAAFTAVDSASAYHNEGFYLAASAGGGFLAPVVFPVRVVSIKKITLYAFDNSSGGDVCLSLIRLALAEVTVKNQGRVCTAGASAGDFQVVTLTSISPRPVNTALHGSYLLAQIPAGQLLHGVRITYSYEI